MVSFRSVDGRQGWDLLLADTNRVQQSKTHSKAVEIESVTGQVYVVSILDSQMLVDSPRRAMRIDQRRAPGRAGRDAPGGG